jgi:hypothetical protein
MRSWPVDAGVEAEDAYHTTAVRVDGLFRETSTSSPIPQQRADAPRLEGMPVDLLTVDEVAPLPGPGLIVGDDLLGSDPALVADVASAVQRAVEAIAATPEIGFDAAAEAVPAIGEERTALSVLEATILLWSTGGRINQAAWESG